MTIGSIAVRYAKALLEYANETGAAERVYHEVLKLKETLMTVPELRTAVNNPLLETKKKANLLEEAIGGEITSEIKRFIQLVLKEKREGAILFMATSYIGLYRKQENISVGSLITATPATPEIVERIRKMVANETKGTAEFTTQVNPNILGGFIFQLGTYRLDASVAHQMQLVKKQFIEKNRRVV
ncbi:MAG: F0F1 ATP synthase subunit delta [Phocaeicola sp.]|uniref:F0F1 ATP synthase subunit delta n=1 Tax=Phocaeicola sp. TaxID=2773926 RepID=UPI003FA01220